VVVYACALCDAGHSRPDNEDRVHADERTGLLIVADGMGGHAGGEVASAIAVDVIRSRTSRALRGSAGSPADAGGLEARLVAAIRQADRAIRDRAGEEPGLAGMGTTVVAAIAHGERVVIAHVGDSPAYLLHDGELTRLTEDHTLVAGLVRAGRLTPRQARTHRFRNVLTRNLGSGTRPLAVDVRSIAWVPPDRLLLCSDGLSSAVTDARIRAVMIRAGLDLDAACRRLVAAANEAGGRDNISVIVATPDGQGLEHSSA
jgi:serine/threonine protein phosphatase PrpC